MITKMLKIFIVHTLLVHFLTYYLLIIIYLYSYTIIIRFNNRFVGKFARAQKMPGTRSCTCTKNLLDATTSAHLGWQERDMSLLEKYKNPRKICFMFSFDARIFEKKTKLQFFKYNIKIK